MKINTGFFVDACQVSVDFSLGVDCRQEISIGIFGGKLFDQFPGFDIAPSVVYFDEGRLIRAFYDPLRLASGRTEQARHTWRFVIQALPGAADRSVFSAFLDIFDHGREDCFGWQCVSFRIPILQQRGAARQDFTDDRIFDRAKQHIHDRHEERDDDKKEKWCHQ